MVSSLDSPLSEAAFRTIVLAPTWVGVPAILLPLRVRPGAIAVAVQVTVPIPPSDLRSMVWEVPLMISLRHPV